MNNAFRAGAAGEQKGVLAVTDEPLVSVDFRCVGLRSEGEHGLYRLVSRGAVSFFIVRWQCSKNSNVGVDARKLSLSAHTGALETTDAAPAHCTDSYSLPFLPAGALMCPQPSMLH